MQGVVFNIGDLEDWKNRIGEWARRNFPLPSIEDECVGSRQRMRQALGMVEEYGELQNALFVGDYNEVRDAVADMMIYSLDLSHTCEFKVTDIVSSAVTPSAFEDAFLHECDDAHAAAGDHLLMGLAVYIGKLCHAVLKWEQGIRMSEDHPQQILLSLCHIWRMLNRYCQYCEWDFNSLVIKTAEKVTKRDWQANPDDAHKKVE